MPKQVIKYQCNFCKKSGVSKSRIINHELECYHNPENKSCSTCCWCIKGDDYYRWCDYLDKEVYIKGEPILNCESWRNKQCQH